MDFSACDVSSSPLHPIPLTTYGPLINPVVVATTFSALVILALVIGLRRNIYSPKYWIVTLAVIALLFYLWSFLYVLFFSVGDVFFYQFFPWIEINVIISNYFQYTIICDLLALTAVLIILSFVETFRSRRWRT